MNVERLSSPLRFTEAFYLPQGGLDPGPASANSTELPSWQFSQPCRRPVRDDIRVQPEAGGI